LKFNIYKLVECGFYNKDNDDFVFGVINQWWNDFIEWFKNKQYIVETKTFQFEMSSTPSVYCSTAGSIDSCDEYAKKVYCLSLWNETPSRDGVVQSLPRKAPINNPKVVDNKIEKDSIPGWASNFIYLPDLKVFISINPDNHFNGRAIGVSQMCQYFKHYLKEHSLYCSYILENDALKRISGWAPTFHDDARSYNAKFTLKSLGIPAEIDRIRNLVLQNEIRNIIYRHNINFNNEEHRSILNDLFTKFGITSSREMTSYEKTYTFETKLPWYPTTDDFDKTFKAWENGSDEIKMGVEAKGQTEIIWFDTARAKGEFELSNDLEIKTVLQNKDFEALWLQAKNSIMKVVRESNNVR